MGAEKERLAAILAADAVGYSRLMASDRRKTVGMLESCRTIFRNRVESYQGRVVDMAGDSVLAVFDSAAAAVQAALAIQKELEATDGELRYRIGVHLGDVLEKGDGSVYGDGVNVAARLQTLAAPGEIAVSDVVRWAVRGRVDTIFVDQGEQTVKNIPAPVRWCRAAMAQLRSGATEPLTRSADQVAALPSIAILPFRTAGADLEQASFADGLRAEIQNALAKIAGLIVIGIATTNAYRNKDVTPKQFAAETAARYVLDALVQKAGERARIHATLTDGASGQVLWSEHHDCVLDDAFEAQEQVTEKVVTAIDVRLMSGEQARVWRKAVKDPRAREHFYRGMHEFMKGQKDANAVARENFEQVARLVPATSIGATHVAFSHWMDAFRGWTPEAMHSFDQAAAWAEKAMKMEDADGQAHTVMGHIHLLRREHDEALAAVEQAVTIRPSCMNANGHFGNILYYCGRPADAADRIRQVMRISPVHPPWIRLLLAASCKELRQWDNARQVAREVLRMKPDDIDARLVLIESALGAGDTATAREVAEEVRKLQPDFSLERWAARQPYRDPKVLERIVERLRESGLN